MSETLNSAAGYLKQLSELEGDDAIEVKPAIVDQIESAAQDAQQELSGA